MATYCLPLRPWYVIGLALPLRSSRRRPTAPCRSSSRARESDCRRSTRRTARRPRSRWDRPARDGRCSACPAGSCSVMPSGTRHAKSPVAAFTAIRLPHGGFWHGQLRSPIGTSKVAASGRGLLVRDSGEPSFALFGQSPARRRPASRRRRIRTWDPTPFRPSSAPPSPPGKTSGLDGALLRAILPRRERSGVVDAAALLDQLRARGACSGVVSAAVTRSCGL